MKYILDKSCIENQNTPFVFSNIFPESLSVSEMMWKIL